MVAVDEGWDGVGPDKLEPGDISTPSDKAVDDNDKASDKANDNAPKRHGKPG